MDTKNLEEEIQQLRRSEEASRRRPKKGRGRWFVTLLVLAGLTYGSYRWWHAKLAAADATTIQSSDSGGRGRGGRGGRGAGGRAAVTTVAARRMDMPVYLRGLGTAAASNTVTVRSRVDGQLIHVAFKEGQFV